MSFVPTTQFSFANSKIASSARPPTFTTSPFETNDGKTYNAPFVWDVSTFAYLKYLTQILKLGIYRELSEEDLTKLYNILVNINCLLPQEFRIGYYRKWPNYPYAPSPDSSRLGRYHKFCCPVGSVWFWLLVDGKMWLPRASHCPWQLGKNRDDAGDCFTCSDKQTSLCP